MSYPGQLATAAATGALPPPSSPAPPRSRPSSPRYRTISAVPAETE